jgi:hypothetical protein
MDDGTRIRERVAALGLRGRGARIPRDLRRDIAEYARRRRSEGIGLDEIAGNVGVSKESVRRWAGRIAPPRAVSVVPVRVRAEAAEHTGLVIQTAHGHRVTGLDLEGAVRLLRILG